MPTNSQNLVTGVLELADQIRNYEPAQVQAYPPSGQLKASLQAPQTTWSHPEIFWQRN